MKQKRQAHNADHEDNTEYVETLEEQIELDAVAYIVEQYGEELLDNAPMCLKVVENQKEIALVAQQKGKARGKGKSSFKYPLRSSHLSLEDRRKRLAKLKAETACRDCGRKGHWSGDAACTFKKKTHTIVQETISLKAAYEEGRKACKTKNQIP